MARPFFSGNYGSNLGSTAQAANLIAQAGQAQGRMYQQLGATIGNTIGSTLQKFRQKKKEKEEQERYKNLLIGMFKNDPSHPLFEGLNIQSIEEAEAVAKDYSKDPKLVEDTLRFAKLAEAKKANDLQMEMLQRQSEMLKRQEEDRLAMNQFLKAPGTPVIDPSGPDRNSVLRNLRAGQGVTPPARMVPGPSAAEQMLATPEAKAFMKRSIEQGAPLQQSMKMAQQIEEANQPRPMSELEVYEGKKIIDEKYSKKPEKDMSGSAVVNDSIDISMELIGPFTTGFGAFLKNIPLTDAQALDKNLETIKANIGFDKLQAMREASPTGGALGQVSNQELSSLQSVFGSLEQSQGDAELKYNLRRLQHIYNNIVHGPYMKDGKITGNHSYPMPTRDGQPEVTKEDVDQARRKLEERKKALGR